jgi:uncharacterized protein (DUF58 family)
MLDPELYAVVKRIEFSARKRAAHGMAGAWNSAFKGNGMAFSEVREYIPGDEVRFIDWNVTARTGIPHIKTFVEERELTLILAIDVSASGLFGTLQRSKAAIMARLAAILACSAMTNNDKVGLYLFSDKLEKYIPPAKGRKHVLRLVQEVLTFVPESKGTRIGACLDLLHKLQRKHSVIFIFSDFFDDNWEKSLAKLNQKHEVVAIPVNDPGEAELPKIGLALFKDAETGELFWADTTNKNFIKQSTEALAQNIIERDLKIKQSGVASIPIILKETDRDTIVPLEQYFRRKHH